MITKVVLAISLMMFNMVTLANSLSPRFFNVDEFAGLVVNNTASLDEGNLDYDLNDLQGNSIHFSNCQQALTFAEATISAPQFILFKRLVLNCRALKRYVLSAPVKQSFFPKYLNKKMIARLPADAVPELHESDIRKRMGKTLAQHEKNMLIQINKQTEGKLFTEDDEINYVIMARGDFDQDGIEDILLRATWRARRAMGQGVGLFWLSKLSAKSPIVLRERY